MREYPTTLPAEALAAAQLIGICPGAKGPGKQSFEAEIERFHDVFRDKNLVGILSMGMDPGAVNVFARWAIDRLDTASSIRVLDADNAEVKGHRFAVLFSPYSISTPGRRSRWTVSR